MCVGVVGLAQDPSAIHASLPPQGRRLFLPLVSPRFSLGVHALVSPSSTRNACVVCPKTPRRNVILTTIPCPSHFPLLGAAWYPCRMCRAAGPRTPGANPTKTRACPPTQGRLSLTVPLQARDSSPWLDHHCPMAHLLGSRLFLHDQILSMMHLGPLHHLLCPPLPIPAHVPRHHHCHHPHHPAHNGIAQVNTPSYGSV